RTRKHVQRRDGFRCACPDCPHRVWLELHHLVFYCRGGLTVPPNMVLTCRTCHRNVHRGWLNVAGNAERSLVWTHRQGRKLGETTADRRREAAEWGRRRVEEAVKATDSREG